MEQCARCICPRSNVHVQCTIGRWILTLRLRHCQMDSVGSVLRPKHVQQAGGKTGGLAKRGAWPRSSRVAVRPCPLGDY